MSDVVSLLERDVYTMGQVDRLLGLGHGTASRWIDGYTRAGVTHEPLIRLERTGRPLVTWGEFVEARLISEYRCEGVSIFRMRPAILTLRDIFETDYPLATARPFTEVEGRELVLKAQQEAELSPALRFVIRTGQGIFPSLEVHRFQQQAEYHNNTVNRLRLGVYIAIDPAYASGEPTITGRRLRVADIAEALAVGESRESIAEMWGLSMDQVSAAVQWSNIA